MECVVVVVLIDWSKVPKDLYSRPKRVEEEEEEDEHNRVAIWQFSHTTIVFSLYIN